MNSSLHPSSSSPPGVPNRPAYRLEGSIEGEPEALIDSVLPTSQPDYHRLWTLVFTLLGVVPIIWALVTPRNWQFGDAQASIDAVGGGPLQRVGRLGLNGLILLMTGSIGVYFLTLRGIRPRGFSLWLGVIGFCLAPIVSSIVAPGGAFRWDLVLIPATFTMIYLMPPVPVDWYVRLAKRVGLFFVYGSLIAGVVARQWAFEIPYTGGVIPGFLIRLHGVAGHANALSPLVLTFLVLDWYDFQNGFIPWLNRSMAALCLLLTQSKTVIGVLAVLAAVRLIEVAIRKPTGQRWLAVIAGGAAAASLGILAATGALHSSNDAEAVSTVSGRLPVWQVTLEMWRPNPWFGYGQDLWGPDMQIAYAGPVGWRVPPGTAHNQWLQAMGESGLVGLTAMNFYLFFLLLAAIRLPAQSRRTALSLLCGLVLMGLTEAIFDSDSRGGLFLNHVLVFTFMVVAVNAIPRGDQAELLEAGRVS